MKALIAAAFFLTLGYTLFAQQPENLPTLDGCVTRSASPKDFDVNGFHVIATEKTDFEEGSLTFSRLVTGKPDPYLGRHTLVFGKLDKRKNLINAKRVFFVPADNAEIKGAALIDSLPMSPTGGNEGKLVRADGYPILLTTTTAVTFTPPLTSLSDVGVNVWISYKGKQREDGVVVATSAALTKNDISTKEDKLRDKADYDPAAVNPNEKQSEASKLLIGVNGKRLPPYHDDAMQARIVKIGESLIPPYQKNLPDTDPTKVHFRFQLVDESVWHDAANYPSGVILVPKQVVERMQNDSQLAAVLADNIADVIEKQLYRITPTMHKVEAVEIASLAAGLVVPGVGWAALGAHKVGEDAEQRVQQQSARVSLGLMKDAGYTLAEAPRAWWILSTKEPKPLVDLKLPDRVQYLYKVLGTTWRGE